MYKVIKEMKVKIYRNTLCIVLPMQEEANTPEARRLKCSSLNEARNVCIDIHGNLGILVRVSESHYCNPSIYAGFFG